MAEENGSCQLGDQFHKGMTIRGVFELWLAAARKEVNAASYANYERIVRRHILPRLGEAVVDYLTVADIRDFLNERMHSGRMDGKGGLSRKTVADISRVLNAGLKLVNWDPDLSDGVFSNGNRRAAAGTAHLSISIPEHAFKLRSAPDREFSYASPYLCPDVDERRRGD